MTKSQAASTSATPGNDDFDEGWRNLFQDQRDMDHVTTTVIRLTEGGAHPVKIEQLAAAVALPAGQVRTLIDRANAGYPSLRTGHTEDEVWLDFAAEAPRFWYQIGDRRIGVAGCGPDIFWTAQALGQPMKAEATCSVTGIPITLEFTSDGVRSVQPADAVVVAINLNTVPEAATPPTPPRSTPMSAPSRSSSPTKLPRNPGWSSIPVAGYFR